MDSFGGTTLLPPKLNTLESEGEWRFLARDVGRLARRGLVSERKKKKVSLSVAGLLSCPGGVSYEGSKTRCPLQFFPVILIMALIICHCSGAALE